MAAPVNSSSNVNSAIDDEFENIENFTKHTQLEETVKKQNETIARQAATIKELASKAEAQDELSRKTLDSRVKELDLSHTKHVKELELGHNKILQDIMAKFQAAEIRFSALFAGIEKQKADEIGSLKNRISQLTLEKDAAVAAKVDAIGQMELLRRANAIAEAAKDAAIAQTDLLRQANAIAEAAKNAAIAQTDLLRKQLADKAAEEPALLAQAIAVAEATKNAAIAQKDAAMAQTDLLRKELADKAAEEPALLARAIAVAEATKNAAIAQKDAAMAQKDAAIAQKDAAMAQTDLLRKELADKAAEEAAKEATKVLKSELATVALLEAQTALLQHKLELARIQTKIHDAQISNLTKNHDALNQMCRNRFYVMNEGEVPKLEQDLKTEQTKSLKLIIDEAIAKKDASSIAKVQKVSDLEEAAQALLEAQKTLLQRELYLAGKQAEIHEAQIHNLRCNHGPINMAFRNRFNVMNEGKVPKLIETLNKEKISLPKLVQAAKDAKAAYDALKSSQPTQKAK